MASSSTLALVNKVLYLTGDSTPITTVIASSGGIAQRIIEFMNLVISDLEKRQNWVFLRANATGLGDGVDALFQLSGLEDIRPSGGVSVSIDNLGSLQELTPEQFDKALAEPPTVSLPTYFVREAVAATGKLAVRIFPTPAVGAVIRVSAYKRPRQLDPLSDITTTEFDDSLLIYGALTHMDAYDGLNRGYGKLFDEHLKITILENTMNRHYRVQVEQY